MKSKPESTHPNAAAFPAGLSGSALRALSAARITSVAQLARWTLADLSELHGMGPKALAALQAALTASGSRFQGG
ncbi:MAG: DNA-binding protein [Gemmatimonadaceae bacterium]|nr:DNA-binding protein [Gemmatimonadaceae bacterium]